MQLFIFDKSENSPRICLRKKRRFVIVRNREFAPHRSHNLSSDFLNRKVTWRSRSIMISLLHLLDCDGNFLARKIETV
jgi:hypothetical protein